MDINIWTVFLTGLLTGGLTCLAVQGGLLATSIAQRSQFAKDSKDKEKKLKQKLQSGNALPILSFLIAKLAAYTILGFFLGWIGSLFQFSLPTTIILLAVFNLNNTLALTGSSFTLENIWTNVYCTFSFCDTEPHSATISNTTITITNNGYAPNNVTVKAGSKVTLRLVNTDSGGCAQAITIPQLGIQRVVPMGSSDAITFTAPSQPQQLAFMCSMGMYRGVINVI